MGGRFNNTSNSKENGSLIRNYFEITKLNTINYVTNGVSRNLGDCVEDIIDNKSGLETT